jgi:hypothetical protein
VSSSLESIIAFVALFAVLVVRPQGIVVAGEARRV